MTSNINNQTKHVELWSALIERATSDASNNPVDKTNNIDGYSFEPIQPYSDILYMFEQYEERPKYISVQQQIGRSTPFSLILEALGSDVSSLNKLVSFDNYLDDIADLIERHYEKYGSMFVQDIFDDLNEFGHLQSAMFIPSYNENNSKALLPIMGFSALRMALERLSYMADNSDTPSNILMLKSTTHEEDISFTYQHVGFACLGRPSSFHSDIGNQILSLIPESNEDIDIYEQELSAVHICIDMVCPNISEFALFKPTISDRPFKYMGYAETPTMWSSIVHTHYVGHPYFNDVAKLVLKYQDISMFWLAATSGLSLNLFRPFIRRDSGFKELNRERKIEILMRIAPLIDHIALSMQSDEYLSKSPLLNLYE